MIDENMKNVRKLQAFRFGKGQLKIKTGIYFNIWSIADTVTSSTATFGK